MNHTQFQPIDSSLPSTVGEILTECPRFRILVLGKTGCGKSSLINKVFGVEIAQVSHKDPGKANINLGFCPEDNAHFILHDSQGFEPGEDANFNIVKDFIEKRSKMPELEDRLHAIWVCSSIPLPGNRVTETGVEKILEIARGNIPLVVVFTKYDKLVTSLINDAGDSIFELEEEQIWAYGEEEARATFEKTSSGHFRGSVPVIQVSTNARYSNTITELIRITDEEVQKHLHTSSHTEAPSLSFAVAQRGDSRTSIEASIDVGRKRYWSGLWASTDFKGQKLKQCLGVIHRDIISVWNLLDRGNHLAGEDFKAKMSRLVEDLDKYPRDEVPGNTLNMAIVASLGGAVASTAGVAVVVAGVTVLFGKWVFDVYQNTPGNIASMMGYIVDLTIVMHRLSVVDSVSEEHVADVLEDYAKSKEIGQVHNGIRRFMQNRSSASIILGQDNVLKEIIRLIESHCRE